MSTATLTSSQLEDFVTQKVRISTIDLMRGIVMVIMALDHTRDFYHTDAFQYDPTDLEKTNPMLFFTRIITHYCAPTFVLLSGAAIKLSEQRKSKKELSLFLLTRGLWLIVLELTVVRFSWFFQTYYDFTIFQVIYTIGISMVVLSVLIYLPSVALITTGIFITVGHNCLDSIRFEPGHALYIPWTLIHQVGPIEFLPGKVIMVGYPFLPWLGIMLLGYGLGSWYTPQFDETLRRKLLIRVGLFAIAAFILLRFFNLYGDPDPWSPQKNFIYSVMSFVNVTKYPPSLLYTLMTLGPVMLIMTWLERSKLTFTQPFLVFGRVPLFYYILHFYLIHLGALTIYLITSGKSFSELDLHFNASFGGLSAETGHSLGFTYAAWITTVALLYPLCRWYNQYKSTHRQWWLSYV